MEPDADVQAWSRDWRRLRHQKHRSRGGVEGSMLLDYLLYEGEHQSVQVQNAILTRAFRHEKDKNKLRLVIPLARRLVDRKIGRHWSIAHVYRATPNTKDAKAFDRAEVIGDGLIPALDYKLQQGGIRWEIFKWQVVCGVAFEHVDWKDGITQELLPKYAEDGVTLLWEDTWTGQEVPETTVNQILASGRFPAERFKPAVEVQTAGDVGADVYDPFRVFVDASVTQVKKLGAGQAIYLADLRSFDWIRDTFGEDATNGLEAKKDLSIIETHLLDRGVPVSGLNLKDLLPLIQGSQDKDDPEMAIVLTRYSAPTKANPYGTRDIFVPDQKTLDAGESPYSEIPVVDYHWSATGATMWTTGFVRDMQALSKFINKRFSQLGEAANAQVYELGLLGGKLKSKDIPTDFPGFVEDGIDPETGMPLVQMVPRAQLPAFFPETIRLSMETLDTIGSSDLLSQRKFPGQLRGSLALPMLQELLDSEDGPRFSHIAEQFSLEKQMRVNRVKKFYEPIRTLLYLGEDQRMEVLEFQTEEVLRAGVDYTVSVDPGSLMPELSAMREARIRERLQWAPGLYVNPRTGAVDWTKIAKDLKYNDRQRDSSENRARKLARQFLTWCRQGKLVAQMPTQPQMGPDGQPMPPQPQLLKDDQPFIIYPFWNHDAMMDEYQDTMETTEFLDASPVYTNTVLTLYEQHRLILAQMDQAKERSTESKMVQSAMSQAASQTAAMAASKAAEVAIEQVMAQQNVPDGGFAQMQNEIRQLMGSVQGMSGRSPLAAAGGPPRIPRRRA